MMPFTHSTLDDLLSFSADQLSTHHRGRVSRHLQGCVRCQEDLRFLHRVQEGSAHAPSTPAPDSLLERIHTSRASGQRIILPAASPVAPALSARRISAVALAASVLVAATVLIVRAPDLQAVASESEMQLSPQKPGAGATIQVSYRPASGYFIGEDSLSLRGRLRTPRAESYRSFASSLRAVAVLRRNRHGEFTGKFTLPDSVVFAALAVEDFGARRVDDRSARAWEVLTHGPDGRPAFDALIQRSNDMMGRSWEEAFASSKRATELFPENVNGWTLREFFERALLGQARDSLDEARSKQRLDSLIELRKAVPSLDESEIGSIFFQRMVWESRKGATSRDSAEKRYWWARIQREYPHHFQVAQELGFYMDTKKLGPKATLDSLDVLFRDFQKAGGARAMRIFPQVARYQARLIGDTALTRLWYERGYTARPDSAKAVAIFLAGQPRFRDEGIASLRALLNGPSARWEPKRTLEGNAKTQARAVADERFRLLGSLGRALMLNGDIAAGRDTMKLAADGVWDLDLFTDMAAALDRSGDAASAALVRARIAVDPNTSDSLRNAITARGRKTVGATRWDSALMAARDLMISKLASRAEPRSLTAPTKLRRTDGQVTNVAALLDGKPTVVIFWSRHCGYALEAVPEIAKVMTRLEKSGTRVIFIAEDDTPTAEFTKFLTERKITWPVFYDVDGATQSAFQNFGTPTYYVLDGSGRIWFDYADKVPDLIAQVEAVAAS
jgi:thiol-disulfide isomerase/thioredoxin